MKVTVTQEYDLENRWQRLKMDMNNLIEWLPREDLTPIMVQLKKAYDERQEHRRLKRGDSDGCDY